MTKKEKLYLVTKSFPYGHGEDSFVKPEYPYLCQRFQVTVIAAETDQLQGSVVHDADACLISKDQSLWDKAVSLIRFLGEKDCYVELSAIIRSREKILKRIYRALMFGTAAETFYRRLKKQLGLNRKTKALFYFYWFDYKCFGLTMHSRKFPGIRIVARTHGYELYDYRELYGKQFFKPQMDARLERLVFAARFAKAYYLNRYGKEDSEKYPLYRLGVSEKGITESGRKSGWRKEFLLVSCSNAVALKRIELIIDGLSRIEGREVSWVHIGAGEELENLRRQAAEQLGKKDNIRYELTGALPNDKVIDFYKENYVSCFITTTSTEGGSPVSVQEALSFGVPVIASAVGELADMIRDNGVLLSENPSGEETARAIERMAADYGTEAYFHMCGASLRIFEEKFNAGRNFGALAEELEELWSNTK